MSTVDIVVRPRSLKTRPYRKLSLGLVDATVVAATEMLTGTKLATLDRLRPAHTEALTTALSSSASRVIASATEGLERRPQGRTSCPHANPGLAKAGGGSLRF